MLIFENVVQEFAHHSTQCEKYFSDELHEIIYIYVSTFSCRVNFLQIYKQSGLIVCSCVYSTVTFNTQLLKSYVLT